MSLALRMAAAMAGGGGASDPYFANVVALLHGDGANGGTTVTDQIGNTWTISGTVTTSSTQLKYGSASLYFNNGHIYTTYGTPFAFGTGDFTIEVCAYISNAGADHYFYGTNHDASGIAMYMQSGNLRCLGAGSVFADIATGISAGWHHFAITRQGTTARAFVDGVLKQTTTGLGNSLSGNFVKFGQQSGTNTAVCYMDELRITKGVARYTATFTPGTAAFPNS